MNRKIAVTGLCLHLLLSVGCMSRIASRQQPQENSTTPTPAPRVEPANGSDTSSKTVAAAEAFLATLDAAGRAKVSFAFNSEQKTKW